MGDVDEMSSIMADLGMNSGASAGGPRVINMTPANASPAVASSGPGRVINLTPANPSSGPGPAAMASSGPGRMINLAPANASSSGPGVAYSSGPGNMINLTPANASSGPGMAYSSGPGIAYSSGPGFASSGPGGNVINLVPANSSPIASSGPGAMASSGPGRSINLTPANASSGPGVAAYSSGPGNMINLTPANASSGPGAMYSSGPGAMASSGPGNMINLTPANGAPMMSNGPGASSGPGRVISLTPANGPGVASSGPGAMMASSGPGAMASSGPGRMINLQPANAAPGVASSGPGAMVSSGPGVASFGPGANVTSFGPGAAAMFGPGANNLAAAPEERIQMATHTPDGREIIHKGPPCANCGEMIIGQCLNALGKTYHPEHFVCACCSQPFQGGKFMIKDDEPYCETDYFELFGNRCRTCKEIIRAQYVNAGPYYFHPEHFVCFTCGKKLIGTKYKTQDNSEDMPVLCVDCHVKRVVVIDPNEKVCAKCKKPIVGQWITLKGQTMHPEHFRCEECGCSFTGGNCHEFEGALYCTEHYEALLKKSCAKCGKPVLGRGVTACGRVWHPEHFGCHVCGDVLSSSSFYEKDNEPYCQIHYVALFGVLCGGCGKPILKTGKSFLDKQYHEECFNCSVCEKPLKAGHIQEWDSKPYCDKCYDKLPSDVRKKYEKKKAVDLKTEQLRQREAAKAERERIKAEEKAAKAKAKEEKGKK